MVRGSCACRQRPPAGLCPPKNIATRLAWWKQGAHPRTPTPKAGWPHAQPVSPAGDIVAPAAASRDQQPAGTSSQVRAHISLWALTSADRCQARPEHKLRPRGHQQQDISLILCVDSHSGCSFPPSFYGDTSLSYYFNFNLIFFISMILIRFSFSFICIVFHLIFTGIYLKAIKNIVK